MKSTYLLGLMLFFFVQFSLSQSISIDNSFGNYGVIQYDLSQNFAYSEMNPIIVGSDNNIYVGARKYDDEIHPKLVVAKFNADGSINAAYGNNGIAYLPTVNYNAVPTGFSLQPDGKLITVGAFTDIVLDPNLLVLRHNVDGSLDSSFGNNGVYKYNTSGGGSLDGGIKSIVLPNGEILIIGILNFYAAMLKLNNAGVLDSNFGSGGIVHYFLENSIFTDGIVLENGKILIGGLDDIFSEEINNYILALFNADGSLDTSFGTDGVVISNFNQNQFIMEDVKIFLQSDDKIILYSVLDNEINPNVNHKFGIARYHIDGTLDTNYGNNGKVIKDLNTNLALSGSALMQPNDQLIVSIPEVIFGNLQTGLIRYNTDGTQDLTIADGGLVHTNFTNNEEIEPYALAWDQDHNIIQSGTIYNSTQGGFLVKYNTGNLNTDDIKASNFTLQLYPNPSSDYFLLQSLENNYEFVSVEIYSLTGSLVKSISEYSMNIGEKINIQDLKSGLYLIKVKGLESEKTLKLIKN